MACYATFVERHFGSCLWVVFDGYASGPTTKDHEHCRRVTKKATIAPNMRINNGTIVTLDQDIFLSNTGNKQQFIDLLAQYLIDLEFEITHSTGDADTDIVVSVAVAIDLARQTVPVIVYAEDTDIVALLVYHWHPSMSQVLIKSDGKRKTPGKYIDIGQLTKRMGPAACQKILVSHAFGGCNATSAIFCHSKGKLFTRIQAMSKHVEVLQNAKSSMPDVCRAGRALMVTAYGGKVDYKLALMRYADYSRMIASTGGSYVAERLPPTEDAAELHALRVHHQAVVRDL
jgi:hypothetical protein